jgi:hypothetical protein
VRGALGGENVGDRRFDGGIRCRGSSGGHHSRFMVERQPRQPRLAIVRFSGSGNVDLGQRNVQHSNTTRRPAALSVGCPGCQLRH